MDRMKEKREREIKRVRERKKESERIFRVTFIFGSRSSIFIKLFTSLF